MRDIRDDLQERANSTLEEIRTLNAECEKIIEQLQKERDAKVAKTTMKLEMLSKLIQFENEGVSKVSVTPPSSLPPRAVPVPYENVTPTPWPNIGQRKVS
jgi:hypothetical protein